jgi:hypothetical protein
MSTSEMTLWRPMDLVHVPKEAKAIGEIAAYAKQLSAREVAQIVKAFDNESYELGSVFIWQKTMLGLKKKLGMLGMEFVGEMLDRKDINTSSSPELVLTDIDALRLAEELGFFPSSQTLRLRHAMELIAHFANPPSDVASEGMMPEEAVGALRTCIQTVLGHAETESAFEFAKFRKQLEVRSFQTTDAEVETLNAAPYFFQRTTLRVLLAVIKTALGAQLEHALANLNTFLPAIWERLLHPDRQSVGWCYSDVHAEGKQTATAGVRAALLKVKGFDYVPETLRSRNFVEAAQRVFEAHHGWNNFHNEYAPMTALASLGTTIPTPALPKCMTAILCVRLGNSWGVSNTAGPIAKNMLTSLPADRWNYYLNECLPADDIILSKLTDLAVAARLIDIVAECNLAPNAATIPRSSKLLEDAVKRNPAAIGATARLMFTKLRSK